MPSKLELEMSVGSSIQNRNWIPFAQVENHRQQLRLTGLATMAERSSTWVQATIAAPSTLENPKANQRTDSLWAANRSLAFVPIPDREETFVHAFVQVLTIYLEPPMPLQIRFLLAEGNRPAGQVALASRSSDLVVLAIRECLRLHWYPSEDEKEN